MFRRIALLSVPMIVVAGGSVSMLPTSQASDAATARRAAVTDPASLTIKSPPASHNTQVAFHGGKSIGFGYGHGSFGFGYGGFGHGHGHGYGYGHGHGYGYGHGGGHGHGWGHGHGGGHGHGHSHGH